MQKWEYAVLEMTNGKWRDTEGAEGTFRKNKNQRSLYERLQELGAEGWEMTGVWDSVPFTLYFKRPKP